jgi:hypothetical protein
MGERVCVLGGGVLALSVVLLISGCELLCCCGVLRSSADPSRHCTRLELPHQASEPACVCASSCCQTARCVSEPDMSLIMRVVTQSLSVCVTLSLC